MAKTEENIDKKEGFGSAIATILWAVGIAFVLRTFLFQPFTIPSGSMEPNLIKGDYIVTSKYSIGYGRYAAAPLPFPNVEGRLLKRDPKRGDIIVFRTDHNRITYIKRLVGLPGDQIQMKSGRLHVNGQAMHQLKSKSIAPDGAQYSSAEVWSERFSENQEHLVFESIRNGTADNTQSITVPDGHYFMMGDNRDHSGDSRMSIKQGGVGLIPAENIIGRAEFILLSAKPEFSLIKPWTWGQLRSGRFFKGLT